MEKQSLSKQSNSCINHFVNSGMCFWFWSQLHHDFGHAVIRALERPFSFTAVPRVGTWGVILDWNKHVIFVFYLPNIMLEKMFF